MNRKLIEAIAEALRESDVELRNDIEPFDYYEVKAEAAVRAYEEFETAPRPRHFYVEGVQFA